MSLDHTDPREEAARVASSQTPTDRTPTDQAPTDRTEEQAPSANGSPPGERDENGRFVRGNRGGPGNPFARDVARIRQRLQAKLTDEEVDAIVDALIAKAKAGEVAAAKLLFAYAIGKPPATVDPDQLDVQEWNHWKSTAPMMYDLPGMIKSMMPEILLEMVRQGRPLASAALSKTMARALMDPESVLPPVPELVMARSDKPLKRGGKPAAAQDAAVGTPGDPAADPRGSEYLASGLGGDFQGSGPAASGLGGDSHRSDGGRVSESRRRAWGLDSPRFGGLPSANGNRKGKKARKAGKPPSTKGDNGQRPDRAMAAPSANGVLGQ